MDSGHIHHLFYHSLIPDGFGGFTRNTGSQKRSPGLDMSFSTEKSMPALWAIADPKLRSEIKQVPNDTARVALAETALLEFQVPRKPHTRRIPRSRAAAYVTDRDTIFDESQLQDD